MFTIDAYTPARVIFGAGAPERAWQCKPSRKEGSDLCYTGRSDGKAGNTEKGD